MLTTRHLLAASAAALTAFFVSAGCSTSAPPALCSTGIVCAEGTQCAAKQPTCISDRCGNGVVDANESCDDGGVTDGDVLDGKTCNSTCTSDETCHNGIRDIGTGEACDCKVNPLTGEKQCDPPEATNCSDDCMTGGLCGNGVPDGTEQCDQGANGRPNWGPTCNIDCTSSKCGDGKTNPVAFEQCDGGNQVNGQSIDCNDNCTPSMCGDGRTNPLDTRMPERQGKGEECDDGTTVGNDWNLACLPNCLANVCGDGHRNTSSKNYEDCDDGPASRERNIDCPWTQNETGCTLCSVCRIVEGVHHWCGDGQTDSHEACDEGAARNVDNIYDQSMCVYGSATCKLCSRNCQSANTAIQGPRCGDNVINSGTILTTTGAIAGKYYEQCDNVYSIACGTCTPPTDPSPCRSRSRSKASATLTINSTSGLAGVTVRVIDGVVGMSVTFEYVPQWDMPAGGQVLANGNIPIEIAGDRNATASNTDDVIGSAFPNITTDSSGSSVTLTNDTASLAGNTVIEVGNNDAAALSATPAMTGGVGCLVGQQCGRNEDCSSGICSSGVCKCTSNSDCPATTCTSSLCSGTCTNGTCH